MKKQTLLKTIKSGMTIILVAATTLTFAQRGGGERRGGGGGGYSSRGSVSGPSASQRGYSGASSYGRSYSQGNVQREAPRVQANSNPVARSYQRNSIDNSRAVANNYRPSARSYNTVNRAEINRGVNRADINRGGINRAEINRGVNRVDINRAGVNRVGVNRVGVNSYRGSYGAYYRPHYSRPPVIYNGYRYYTHYNYSYHPYIPFYYGTYFHPFGFFSLGLSPYAYQFGWNNQDYWYDQGTYYQPYNNGYQAVPAPQGASVNNLPNGYTTVEANGGTFYYYAGTFYLNGDKGFEVVPAPPGAVVYDLPEGAKEKNINGTTYVNYNGTWYLPVTIDGKDGYEVVDVEKDDNF